MLKEPAQNPAQLKTISDTRVKLKISLKAHNRIQNRMFNFWLLVPVRLLALDSMSPWFSGRIFWYNQSLSISFIILDPLQFLEKAGIHTNCLSDVVVQHAAIFDVVLMVVRGHFRLFAGFCAPLVKRHFLNGCEVITTYWTQPPVIHILSNRAIVVVRYTLGKIFQRSYT